MGKFTSETARIAGQKSKRGRAKRDPIVHDAMEILLTEGMAKLYEKMDELNASQLFMIEATQASRIASSKSGSQLGLGASPFVGAEYFLKEKFSLGIEFHLATSLNTTLQRSRDIYTSYDALSQSLYQTDTRGPGFTAFSSAPALMGGGLLFTIYL